MQFVTTIVKREMAIALEAESTMTSLNQRQIPQQKLLDSKLLMHSARHWLTGMHALVYSSAMNSITQRSNSQPSALSAYLEDALVILQLCCPNFEQSSSSSSNSQTSKEWSLQSSEIIFSNMTQIINFLRPNFNLETSDDMLRSSVNPLLVSLMKQLSNSMTFTVYMEFLTVVSIILILAECAKDNESRTPEELRKCCERHIDTLLSIFLRLAQNPEKSDLAATIWCLKVTVGIFLREVDRLNENPDYVMFLCSICNFSSPVKIVPPIKEIIESQLKGPDPNSIFQQLLNAIGVHSSRVVVQY
jgi:hypothetical protein